MIDPSVLDLLNAVVRAAPDNALDMMAAAATFAQIERLWSFAKAENGGAVMAMIRRDADQLAGVVGRCMGEERRIELGQGAIGYRGPTFERRLALVVELAERLESSAVAALIEPMFERLKQEWELERPDINDSAHLLRTVERPARRGQARSQLRGGLFSPSVSLAQNARKAADSERAV